MSDYNMENCVITGVVQQSNSPESALLNIVRCNFTTDLDSQDFSCVESQSDNVFDADLKRALPDSLLSYTPENLRFDDYNLNGSLSSSYIETQRNDIHSEDALGNARVGSGDLFFSGSPAPQEYWCDANEGTSEGSGTEIDPWNSSQLLSYCKSDTGYVVTSGDIVNIMGEADIAEPLVSSLFRFADIPVGANLTFRKWGDQQFVIKVSGDHGGKYTIFDCDYDFNIDVRGAVIAVETQDVVALINCGSARFYTCQIYVDTNNSVVFNEGLATGSSLQFFGSNVSVAGAPTKTATINSGVICSARFTDTVLKVKDIGVANVGGQIVFDNIETNAEALTFSVLPNTSISSSFFNNPLILGLPDTVTPGLYNESDFNYLDFDVLARGKGQSYWQSNQYETGLIEFKRLGIGAFIFPIGDYYVDYDRLTDGAGSNDNPWCYEQLSNYLMHNTSATTHVVTSYVANGDVINVRGALTRGFGYSLFEISDKFSGNVTIKAWDLKRYGMHIVDTASLLSDKFYIVTSYSTNCNVVIKDLCFIQSDTTNASTFILNNEYDNPALSVRLKNSMIFGYTGNILVHGGYGELVYMYGCNISGNINFNAISELWDCCIKSNSISVYGHQVNFTQTEFNIDESSIDVQPGSTANYMDCEFESAAPALLPDDLTSENFNKDTFLYSLYGFILPGSGKDQWLNNDYNNGIYGNARSGIGAFYFYSVAPTLKKTYHPIPTTDCHEDDVGKRTFWDYISTFFDFLSNTDRDSIEAFWHGLWISGYSLIKKITRLSEASSIEDARTCVFDDYYDIRLGALYAMPINPDPTQRETASSIIPIGKVLSEALYDGDGVRVFNDLIQLNARDYYRFRDIAIGAYVVVKSKKEGVAERFFKVRNTLSSEEQLGSDRYYQPAKDGSSLYMVELDGGDLEYLGDDQFSLYFTTALTYKVGDEVLDLPRLQTFVDSEFGVELILNRDYVFINGILEFANNIFDNRINHGEYVYCKKTPVIEQYLYEQYGELTGITDWQRFNHSPIASRAAFGAAVSSLMNSSNINDYNRLLSVYYGLPVVPEDGECVGLYESYGYEVISVNANIVGLRINPGVPLSGLIQPGCEFWTDHKPSTQVLNIVDSESGTIELFDGSSVSVGDLMYLSLPNGLPISGVEMSATPGQQSSFIVSANEHAEMFAHLINMIRALSNDEEWPEVLVYGTRSGDNPNYDGVYHITAVDQVSAEVLRFYVYSSDEDSEPLYNDYVAGNDENVARGVLHIQWPTHKFALLYMGTSQRYYKAYLDAPIDTVLQRGDAVSKYQVIARTANALNSDAFKHWSQFNVFKRYSGIDEDVSVVEGTAVTPFARFGQYLPSAFV